LQENQTTAKFAVVQNIYNEAELSQISTVKKILTVQVEGNREVNRELEHSKLKFINIIL
jgi:hypothetical protein